MTLPDLSAFINLAHQLADAVAPISMKYFRTDLNIISKSDDSPVTIADREAERVMRELIEAAFPEHGIYGEELGQVRIDAEYVWVLDPIDGTRSFVTGKPLFGTLIGLMRDGKPYLGVMDMPALKERWLGAPGRQTTWNGESVHVRSCPSIDQAWMYVTSPEMFTDKNFPRFETLRDAVKSTAYGADCYGYGLLAMGLVDLVCEDTLQPYDYAALVPIVQGAGGVMTDWNGTELGLQSEGHVLVAGDGETHRKGLEILQSQTSGN